MGNQTWNVPWVQSSALIQCQQAGILYKQGTDYSKSWWDWRHDGAAQGWSHEMWSYKNCMWQIVSRVHPTMNEELTMLKSVDDSEVVSLLAEILVTCDCATAQDLCVAFNRCAPPSAEHDGSIVVIWAENVSNQWMGDDILWNSYWKFIKEWNCTTEWQTLWCSHSNFKGWGVSQQMYWR